MSKRVYVEAKAALERKDRAALTDVHVVRVKGVGRTEHADRAATEEPLEVRLHGKSFSVIMRTPAPTASWQPASFWPNVCSRAPTIWGRSSIVRIGPGGSGPARGGQTSNVINVTLMAGLSKASIGCYPSAGRR